MIPVYPDSVEIDVELSGAGSGWTTLQDVKIDTPITIQRGNEGTSQRDRVAQTGVMTFALNNAADNSAGLLGYYSPRNSNALSGWIEGIGVRCVVTFNAVPYTVFRGSIDAITPKSGMYGERKVNVACVDWMDEAAKARVKGLAIQINKASSEVFSAILAAVERQPIAKEIGAGIDEYPYSLDNAFDAEVAVLSEFQRLMQSELGRVYVKADGTLVMEGRHTRPNADVVLTLTDSDIYAVDTGRGREAIVNYSEVAAHPRRVDTAATAQLFLLSNKPAIAIGETYEVTGLFRDPDAKASRVGGMDMVTPVEGTDYVFNTAEDGSGSVISSQLDVTATYYANSVKFEITNNGPFDGYLTTLQCRGKGIYAYEAVVAKGESQDSKDQYGEVGTTFDMPYQDDIRVAKDAADFIVQQSKAVYTTVRGVTIIPNRSEEMMLQALTREISDKLVVQETVTGTDSFTPPGETEAITPTSFFINAVRLQIYERGIMRCRWTLEPADPFNYWILEKTGYTELGETTRLAYGAFVPGWILGSSVLGTGTIVNS